MTNDTSNSEAGLPLTRREKQVGNLLCRGLTNKEVAIKLDISPRTVEDHRFHIMRKYGVRNSIELVRVWYGIDKREIVTQ